MSTGSLWVGNHPSEEDATPAPWQVVLNFSKPVNSIVVLLSGGGNEGRSGSENFIFSANQGTISINSTTNCYATISGNTIYTTDSNSSYNDGGGIFNIQSTSAFTKLTISGNGGLNGSLLGICSASIIECAVATPTVTTSGALSFCNGGSVTLTSSATSGNQWYKDGVLISGATNRTYVANTAGAYTVVVTTGGCSSSASAGRTVSVTTVPTPTVTTSGALSFCNGGSVTLTSSATSGNQWYKDGVLISGDTNRTYVANTAGAYTVVVITGGCSSSASAGRTVSVTTVILKWLINY